MLADMFLAHVPGGAERLAPTSRLETTLAALLSAGRAAWPDVRVPDDVFLRHLAERLPADGDAAATLEQTHAADLYLACGCAHGDPAAIAAFERELMPQVALFLDRADALPEFTDELKQQLRERLLVARAGLLPRIGGYTGRGPLGAWLRTATARAAVDLRRARGRPETAEALDLPGVTADPELAYLKGHYAEELKAAFAEALGKLAPRERNVLALYYLDGVSSQDIGAAYNVDARSVRRWIDQARDDILRATLRHLEARLKLPRAELERLIGMLQSRLDFSIRTMLVDR
jgi:RNA polymerase sigma-70 factor (ECF subfamily)